MNPWVSLILGGLFGCFLDSIVKFIATKIIQNKEIKENDYIDISGVWYAAWQTSVDGQQLINTEHVTIEQHGKTVIMKNNERSPENPKGGYLWQSKLQFYQGRNLMGGIFH